MANALTNFYKANNQKLLGRIARSTDLGTDLTISIGNVPGHSDVFQNGFHLDISTTEGTVWDGQGLYRYLLAPASVTLSAASENDKGGGTGAREILVTGLDGDFSAKTVTASTNGSVAVSLGIFSRIFRMEVTKTGDTDESAANVGIIYVGHSTVTAGVPSHILAEIEVGMNHTQMALYTVPRKNTGFLHQFTCGSFSNPNNNLIGRFVTRKTGQPFVTRDQFLVSRGTFKFRHDRPARITALTDMEVRAKSDGGVVDATATFEFDLVMDGT